MNSILDNKYPYLTNFFNTAISQNRLFHSLILYGSNNYIQYALAMELARQLNCLEKKQENCNCQNCRWIRENKHPAVMTISKIDNKNDARSTVISEEQVNSVLDTLVNSSDFHRIFIFWNADIKKLSSAEMKDYEEYKSTGFSLPQEISEDKIWYPSGVNTNCFSSVAANSMLKSIEEPPSNVTFIFLTNNKDDLLQTIVSRSQAFYVPDKRIEEYNIDFFKKYFNNYPQFNRANALDFASDLFLYQSENNLEGEYIIDCIQFYLKELAKANIENKISKLELNAQKLKEEYDKFPNKQELEENYIFLNKIFKDIEKTENSKKMLRSYIKEQTVYEDLAFYFAN